MDDCATFNCNNPATRYFERHGVGTRYCDECFSVVERMFPAKVRAALTPASDGRAEGLREAATDRVTDWLVPEMADEIARLRAENGVLRDDHGRLQTKACVAVDAARNAEAESTRLRAEVERLRKAERTAWERGRDAAVSVVRNTSAWKFGAPWHREDVATAVEKLTPEASHD